LAPQSPQGPRMKSLDSSFQKNKAGNKKRVNVKICENTGPEECEETFPQARRGKGTGKAKLRSGQNRKSFTVFLVAERDPKRRTSKQRKRNVFEAPQRLNYRTPNPLLLPIARWKAGVGENKVGPRRSPSATNEPPVNIISNKIKMGKRRTLRETWVHCRIRKRQAKNDEGRLKIPLDHGVPGCN